MDKWKQALYIFLILKFILVLLPLNTPDGGVLVDSRSYLDLAENWEKTGSYMDVEGETRDLVRPPGYPAIILIAQKVIKDEIWPVVFIQLIFLSGCSLLMIWLGSSIGRPLLGLVAAWLFALNPNATLWSLTIMTETAFTFCVLASACLLAHGMQGGKIASFVSSAVALGVACYIRPIGLVLGPAWAAILLGFKLQNGFRYSYRNIALFFVTILIVLIPWFGRNQVVHDRFTFSTVSQKTLLGFNLAEVISQAEGIPRNEAIENFGGMKGTIGETLRIFDEHPLDFMRVQALGIFRTAIGSDIGTWGNVMGWDTWKGFGLISGIFNRSVDYGTNPLEAGSGIEGILHKSILVYSLLYSAVLYFAIIVGGLVQKPTAFMSNFSWVALVTAAILIFTPLASGQARFRTPAEPFLAWLAAAGLVKLKTKIDLSLKSNQ